MNLITKISLWLFPCCLIIAAIYTYFLYFYKKKVNYGKKINTILIIIRFLTVSIILFLLLEPIVKIVMRNVEKPIIIIGIDNSQSIKYTNDSAFVINELIGKINKLNDNLSKKFTVKSFAFGNKIEKDKIIDFNDKQTNISEFFDNIEQNFVNQNIGAVVLISDGIYNFSRNPLNNVKNFKFPIYTLNLGDTNIKRDLIIKRILHNKSALKGNKFPVEIEIQANNCNNESANIDFFCKDSLLFSKKINIASTNQSFVVQFMPLANSAGLVKYTVKATAISDEHNVKNNEQSFFIDIKNEKYKIGILSNSPHPDVGAIVKQLQINENYDVEVSYNEMLQNPLNKYNILIINQLPSAINPSGKLLSEIKKYKIPSLYIVGNQSNISNFDKLEIGLSISGDDKIKNEAFATLNNNFYFFTLSNQTKEWFNTLPPLTVPFGKYNVSTTMSPLLYQKIGNIVSEMPLIAFNQLLEKRSVVILGEGLWRWSMNDFESASNTDRFNELLSKIINFLLVEKNEGKLQLSFKNLYLESENIEVVVNLYNDNNELITSPVVLLTLTDENNKNFDFEFVVKDNYYYLNMKTLSPGYYKYIAKANNNGNILTKSGGFWVQAIEIESVNTIANHALLNNLSRQTNGKSFYPKEFDKIEKAIIDNKNIKPVAYLNKQYVSLIKLKYLLLSLLALLLFEWFLRKYYGNY